MKFSQFLVVVTVLLINNTIDGAQAPFKETTCEDFALIFANKQTAQKSIAELAVLIDELFPVSRCLTSAFSTAPTELVDIIIEYLDEPRSAQGDTPLMIFLNIAQDYGYSRDKINFVVKLLLRHGAHPDACNKFGMTPLHLAATYSLPDVVDILLNYKDQININAQNNDGETPLHTAVRKAGICPSLRLKETLLMLHALIAAGADPNIPSLLGPTPLHTAILLYQDQLVTSLFSAPTIDATIKNAANLTPLECAKKLYKRSQNLQQTLSSAERQAAFNQELVPLAKIISLLESHQAQKTN